EYLPDYAINLVIYLDQRPLSPDYLVVHQYRELVNTLYIGRSMLMSLIDFVESFGGNSQGIYEEIRNLDAMVGVAAEFYLDQDNEAALEAARKAREKQVEIEELSVEIKNQALMWVYITEWLAVTGTGLLSGFVIWTLMIRRGLYREIETTRLRERSR
ncbi:MAG: hypothetical protein HXS50_01035, partial [Theionarchaea archaeon]|nr:hypothetical protein [Theionarchaea archaeon]